MKLSEIGLESDKYINLGFKGILSAVILAPHCLFVSLCHAIFLTVLVFYPKFFVRAA